MTVNPNPDTDNHVAGLDKILEALRNLKFGSVEITVHEGRIVQIERREKLRISFPIERMA